MRAAFPLGILAVPGAIVLMIILQALARKRRRGSSVDDVQKAAMRGWRLDVKGRSGSVQYVYAGQTAGVPWRFFTYQDLTLAKGGAHGQRNSRDDLSRWESDAVRLDKEILAIFPSGGRKDVSAATPTAPSFMARLAAGQAVKGMGGDTSDAENLSRAQVVNPAQSGLQQYLFRASRPELVEQFLDSGAASTLARGVNVLFGTPKSGLMIFAVAHQGTRLVLHGVGFDLERIAALAQIGAELVGAAQKCIER